VHGELLGPVIAAVVLGFVASYYVVQALIAIGGR
jgi:hypothetical protein